MSKTPKKTETMPEIPNMIRDILSTIGLSSECRVLPDSGGQTGWGKYRFPKADGSDTPVPVLLFDHKAKAHIGCKESGLGHLPLRCAVPPEIQLQHLLQVRFIQRCLRAGQQ